ncbi:hypothetical protein Lesp02_24030 [Lentzea sp. NBRC 105346]|uniref:hypothetical protein n=1 Tax=Lentzea sp. NBRC 105346 TaxID=3032205 RepID=UPI0024A2DEE2|nr:hypothetical protein [Lentzea sp. NBRC 105346]GLZ30213.1 hypothetical protein Lesp02_24030 [Lentzea sp. NBRC 105346]
MPLRIAFWLAVAAVVLAVLQLFAAFRERVALGLEVGDFVVGGFVGVALTCYLIVTFRACRGRNWARLMLSSAAAAVVVAMAILLVSERIPVEFLRAVLVAGALPIASVVLMWLPSAHRQFSA